MRKPFDLSTVPDVVLFGSVGVVTTGGAVRLERLQVAPAGDTTSLLMWEVDGVSRFKNWLLCHVGPKGRRAFVCPENFLSTQLQHSNTPTEEEVRLVVDWAAECYRLCAAGVGRDGWPELFPLAKPSDFTTRPAAVCEEVLA